MVALFSFAVFAGAFVASISVIVMMIAPEWQRIMSLMAGNTETSFAPLTQLAMAEQRIAARRWAARPVPVSINRLRAAA